ncbi:MAG: hypothetical protein QOE06_878 [Thermoleophilaceae bacterium]|jgi:hypothetical protein|nr:hypothetical protein [Thermoleophilaceae bacterium]
MVRTQVALVAVAALALAPAAHAASPMKGAAYTGETSQGEIVSFGVSKDGKHVIELATSLNYKCTAEHDGQAGSFVLDTIKVKSGTFTAQQDLHGTTEASVVQGGTGKATGTFKRKGRRATGFVRSQITLRTGETCDSGRITFAVSLL